MEYVALKPFTWNGRDLNKGETIDIQSDHPRIGALARAKFVRIKNYAGAVKAQRQSSPPVKLAEVQSIVETSSPPEIPKSPRAIVAEAKARAEQVKIVKSA